MPRVIRKYIRHPSQIPLRYQVAGQVKQDAMNNIGEGGLCFTSNNALVVGCSVRIKIPVCHPPFDAEGIVRWCIKKGKQFLVGVAFADQTIQNSIRMVEQICHIESYRAEVKQKQGVALTSEEAARQWIAKYAANFPGQLE